ncbi:putative NBD/HSP70 family sugar kinase [Diaminobutyricimonas aerilata]|uniref:Putative NBD/HSP70 family sugar kinase n=1 Tax=Diaminobutyricimonas aerilata TaxID=1162967 RepID=A0A2M9CMK0_9MICO|nr:ROK family transcriptional regulator [Diaminobutyricimonas aerilata]PJJ73112.1 putative NBD/HSP70 family sugar kinase [Diaminobutyricimonas aerilata]
MTTGYADGRALRPTRKVLPEHARQNNRALVLQTLYRAGSQSRADVARATGLTRVTVSDLVAELIGEGLVVELGQREDARPGKPATLIDMDREAFHIVGVDLSEAETFSGAVLGIDGGVLHREELALAGSTGTEATAKVVALIETLLTHASRPVLGIGVGSPGVVDLGGVVLSAPNLGWSGEDLQGLLAERFDLPVVVANDANAAALAEHSFGGALSDMMLVKIGHGVGAGLVLGGTPVFGSRFAAGEIGHVVVGTDGGAACACGKHGCLETWLATPRLDAALAAATTDADREAVLTEAGQRLGIALAPVVGALNLAEVVVSGPAQLLDGTLTRATVDTLRRRTMAEFHGDLTLRMTALGRDIVMRGAAAMVLSGRLGVS